MKNVLLLALVIIVVGSVSAGGMGLGAGLIVSDGHVGLTVEKSLPHHSSASLAVFEESLHLDYLRHNDHLIQIDHLTFPVFFGLGVGIHSTEHHGDTEIHYAARIPVGLSYYAMHHSLEGFLEAVPTLTFGDETEFDLGLAFGLRYHL